MRPLLLAAALAALTLLPAPALAADHGVDWTATGVATDGAGRAAAITVDWNGCLGCFYGVYTVTLTDLASGQITRTAFPGYESVSEYNILRDEMSINGVSGRSATSSVAFAFGPGMQVATTIVCTCPHVLTEGIMGTYQGLTFVAAAAELYHTD